jgi:hypothetical protein
MSLVHSPQDHIVSESLVSADPLPIRLFGVLWINEDDVVLKVLDVLQNGYNFPLGIGDDCKDA